jgi:hypothetical protein
MMGRIFSISAYIFSMVILCAPSCRDEMEGAGQEEILLRETRDEIRKEFETEYLTETSLFAYEAAAKQKLADVAGYIRVLADSSLDMSFRSKAGEMIEKIFLSGTTGLAIMDDMNKSGERIEVQNLIKEGLADALIPVPLYFEMIRIGQPLHRMNDTTYFGTLNFTQTFRDPSKPDQLLNSVSSNAEIFVIRENKSFGNETMKIWVVRLGEIR